MLSLVEAMIAEGWDEAKTWTIQEQRMAKPMKIGELGVDLSQPGARLAAAIH